MVCWICGVRLEQHTRTQELHEKLDIISVTKKIRWCRLRYFGHLQRMDKNVWPRRAKHYVVPGILPRGHPQLCWSDVITKDLKDLNIRKELADEQVEWRRAIMPIKIQLQIVPPIKDGQVLQTMGKVRYGNFIKYFGPCDPVELEWRCLWVYIFSYKQLNFSF